MYHWSPRSKQQTGIVQLSRCSVLRSTPILAFNCDAQDTCRTHATRLPTRNDTNSTSALRWKNRSTVNSTWSFTMYKSALCLTRRERPRRLRSMRNPLLEGRKQDVPNTPWRRLFSIHLIFCSAALTQPGRNRTPERNKLSPTPVPCPCLQRLDCRSVVISHK